VSVKNEENGNFCLERLEDAENESVDKPLSEKEKIRTNKL
jgi:hypothetical protein